MSISGPHIRSEHFRPLDYTVPGGGCVAGNLTKVGDPVGVYAETKAAGQTVALVYQADAILAAKKNGTGESISLGAKVYYEAASGKLTGVAGSNTLCGRCLEAAAEGETQGRAEDESSGLGRAYDGRLPGRHGTRELFDDLSERGGVPQERRYVAAPTGCCLKPATPSPLKHRTFSTRRWRRFSRPKCSLISYENRIFTKNPCEMAAIQPRRL